MSYSISYRREVRWVPYPKEHVYQGLYDRLYFVFEEIGDNNVYECTGRSPALERRSRDWQVVVVDTEHDCFSELAKRSASCPGGDLKFAGSSKYITPEGYLRSWRQAFKNALPLFPSQPEWPRIEVNRKYDWSNPEDRRLWNTARRADALRFSVQPFTRLLADSKDSNDLYRLKILMQQTQVKPYELVHNDKPGRQWDFNPEKSDELAMWLRTRSGHVGWQYCRVWGPHK